jgi:hypothetical protein
MMFWMSDTDFQDATERFRDALKDNRQLHRRVAPLFSPFEALSPSENGLSRMLGYLFDKRSGHGQGTDFLEQFLKLIGCDWRLGQSQIQTEYFIPANGRRIDVLITLGDGCRIGIENKAWEAAEQREQCQDYCRELDRLSVAGGSPGRWLLIFLTPDGGKPKTLGEYENDQRIKQLRCDKLAEAFITWCDTLGLFLTSLQRFVRERVNGEPPLHTGEKEMIEKFLEPKNIDVTVEIIVRIRDVRQELLKRFKEAMVERIRNTFEDPSWKAEILVRGGHGSRSRRKGFGPLLLQARLGAPLRGRVL